jgi:hypothetical protein
VSEVLLSTIEPDPENIPFVVAAIQERATEIYRRGISEERAYHDAAVDVMLAPPDTPGDRTSDWVLKIAHRFWPQAFSGSGSAADGPVSESGGSGRRGTVHG